MILSLGACSMSFVKSADEACGPYPGPDEVSKDVELVAMGWDSPFHQELARQPFTYVQCRAANGDQDAQYVLGLFYLDGIQIEPDYRRATALFAEATYKPAGRGNTIVRHNGDYAGIVNFETTPEKPGVLDAYYQLGKMHEQGLIKGVDLELAEWFYNIAATKGHRKALEALENLQGKDGET